PAGSYENVVQWHVPQGVATQEAMLSGPTGFVKQGAGTLDLRGEALAFGGQAIVREGTLAINNAFSGSVSVEQGAVLQGSAWIGKDITVESGGQLQPGNSDIGAFIVGGDLKFEPGSLFLVDASADPDRGADKVST